MEKSKTGIQKIVEAKERREMAKEMKKAIMKAQIYKDVKNGSK